jgi:hypothetical protein
VKKLPAHEPISYMQYSFLCTDTPYTTDTIDETLAQLPRSEHLRLPCLHGLSLLGRGLSLPQFLLGNLSVLELS